MQDVLHNVVLIECFCALPSTEAEDHVGVDAGLDPGHDAGFLERLGGEDGWVEVGVHCKVLQDGGALVGGEVGYWLLK